MGCVCKSYEHGNEVGKMGTLLNTLIWPNKAALSTTPPTPLPPAPPWSCYRWNRLSFTACPAVCFLAGVPCCDCQLCLAACCFAAPATQPSLQPHAAAKACGHLLVILVAHQCLQHLHHRQLPSWSCDGSVLLFWGKLWLVETCLFNATTTATQAQANTHPKSNHQHLL